MNRAHRCACVHIRAISRPVELDLVFPPCVLARLLQTGESELWRQRVAFIDFIRIRGEFRNPAGTSVWST